MVYCTHCGNELNRAVDWTHLGPETEDYICRNCGKMTTIPAQINENLPDLSPRIIDEIAEENFRNRMKLLQKRANFLLLGGNPNLMPDLLPQKGGI